jgi:ABC-type glycerol-3-phosphate transport system permease component
MGMLILVLVLNLLAAVLMGFCLSFERRKTWRVIDWILLVANLIWVVVGIYRILSLLLLD